MGQRPGNTDADPPAQMSGFRSAAAAWFRPERWSPSDMIIAVSALVLAVSVFVPWFKATVRIRGSSVSGFLIEPRGTVDGITVHAYLWAVFGLALLQFAVLAARHVPVRRAPRLPGYRQVLMIAAGLSCTAVLVAAITKPSTWHGGNELGGGFYLVVEWTYGAFIAAGAAIVSFAFAVAAIQDHPGPGRPPRSRA